MRIRPKIPQKDDIIYKYFVTIKVPFDPVELEMNNKTQGLVSPEAFQLPPISPLWTPVAYAAFDESKLTGKVPFIYLQSLNLEVLHIKVPFHQSCG
jgi:hypothetical protein